MILGPPVYPEEERFGGGHNKHGKEQFGGGGYGMHGKEHFGWQKRHHVRGGPFKRRPQWH
jgi:hypothetical protein